MSFVRLPATRCDRLRPEKTRRRVQIRAHFLRNDKGQGRRASGSAAGRATLPGVPCADWLMPCQSSLSNGCVKRA